MNRDKEQLFRDALLLLLASVERDCRKTSYRLYEELGGRRCGQYFGIHDVYQLECCLQSCTKLFDIRANGRNNVSIIPKTSLAVCRNHSNRSGSCPEGTCPDLHFCKYFLLSGECCFGQHCLFGHDMRIPHNQSLLKRHLLWGLNFTDLRTLFCLPRVRQGVTIPQVCKFYNVMKGCTKGAECHSLHLCLHYVQDQCKFANRCARNHDINHPQVTKVLTLFGVKVRGRKLSDILQEVRFYNQKHEEELDSDDEVSGCRPARGAGATPKRSGSVPNLFRGLNMSTPPQHGAHPRAPSVDRRPRTTSESSCAQLVGAAPRKTEEICLYFLKGKCRFEEKCHRLHSGTLYLWRLTSAEGGSDWWGLPPDSDRQLEEAYSQPQNNICTVTDIHGDELVVEFRNMTAQRSGQKYMVRRVSTPSSVDPTMRNSMGKHSNNARLATFWMWYWKNQQDVWVEFGTEETNRLPVSSKAVEERFQMGVSTPMTIDHFVLDFGTMRLKDVGTSRKFKVRRRPLCQLRGYSAESNDTTSGSDSESILENRGSSAEEDDDKDDEARARQGSFREDFYGIDVQAHTRSDIPYNARGPGRRAEDASPSAEFLNNVLSPIHGGSNMFMKIKRRFTTTLGVACRVLGIHKVDNPQLEARYRSMKSSMARHCRSEMELYYGPSPNEDVTSVYTSGVDCDSPAVLMNGISLGRGGHFHVNAAQANKSIQRKGERRVFVMKCLVGSGRGQDCNVDDIDNPRVYIISNPAMVCPIYVITYRLS